MLTNALYLWETSIRLRIKVSAQAPCRKMRGHIPAGKGNSERPGIDPYGRKMTVCELTAKQNRYRGNVRHNAVKSRERLMKLLESDPLGACPIESVEISDANERNLRMGDRGIAIVNTVNYYAHATCVSARLKWNGW